jgi:hypothetical protein
MKVIKILHYIALILGFQASAFFLFFLISEGVGSLIEGKIGIIPILILMLISVGGFVWSVIKPVSGPLILISGGLLNTVYLLFMGGISEYKMALIFGLPFIIPGVILYFTSKSKPITN